MAVAGSDRPLRYTCMSGQSRDGSAVAGSDRPLRYTRRRRSPRCGGAVAGSDRPLRYTPLLVTAGSTGGYEGSAIRKA